MAERELPHGFTGGNAEGLHYGIQVGDASNIFICHTAMKVDVTLGELEVALDHCRGGVGVRYLREMDLASPQFALIILSSFAF